MPPRAALQSGPARDMISSFLGFDASLLICATPPRMNRVMLFTGMPVLLLTMECAASCAISEAKKSRLVAIPTIQ